MNNKSLSFDFVTEVTNGKRKGVSESSRCHRRIKKKLLWSVGRYNPRDKPTRKGDRSYKKEKYRCTDQRSGEVKKDFTVEELGRMGPGGVVLDREDVTRRKKREVL